MTDTANLGLPFIDGGQAQKHVTHNDALQILDDIIQIAVLDRTITVPPTAPSSGERHIVAAGATGAWAGRVNAIAVWESNAWRLISPKIGWLVWSVADNAVLVFNGSNWGAITTAGASSLENAAHIGVNTTASSPNLLSVRSNSSLFNAIATTDGGTGDVRLQLSKATAGNTASMFFSDAFSGRAEFGLTGDDDFHLRVSADGSAWRDAMTFDRTTGRVSFPSGGAREVLSANRTYYVRTDGNDGNNGLANVAAGAFRTLQRAWSAILGLDLNGFAVTVQVGVGTHTAGLDMLIAPLGGSVSFIGDTTTPANVTLSTTADDCFNLSCPATVSIRGFRLQTATSGYCLFATGGGAQLIFGNIDFGPAVGGHIRSLNCASIADAGLNYTISGGSSGYHLSAAAFGAVSVSSAVVTLTGTPAFGGGFAQSRQGTMSVVSVSYSGVATGVRYSVDLNGVINTFGGGASYLPGSISGTTATGGLYG